MSNAPWDDVPASAEAVTATLKGGPGYEAPWLVFKGSTTDDVKNLLANSNDLVTETANAARHFHGVYAGTALTNEGQTAQGNGAYQGGSQQQPTPQGGGSGGGYNGGQRSYGNQGSGSGGGGQQRSYGNQAQSNAGPAGEQIGEVSGQPMEWKNFTARNGKQITGYFDPRQGLRRDEPQDTPRDRNGVPWGSR